MELKLDPAHSHFVGIDPETEAEALAEKLIEIESNPKAAEAVMNETAQDFVVEMSEQISKNEVPIGIFLLSLIEVLFKLKFPLLFSSF